MIKVIYASDCPPCGCCGEPFCETHGDHYADCPCIGPTQEAQDRLAILNAHSIADAARILGMTVGSVRVLRARLKRAGAALEPKQVGRPKATPVQVQ